MVMLAYLLSGGLVAVVFLNLGPLVLLLAPLLMVLYAVGGFAGADRIRRSHYWFLFRTQIWLLLIMTALYLLPLWALWQGFDPESEFLALLNTRDPDAIAAWIEMWIEQSLVAATAWTGGALALVFLYLTLHVVLSLVIAVWLAVRLVRRMLRWTDGQAA